MKKCPDCGMVIANQAIRCPKCKYDFTDGQGAASAGTSSVSAVKSVATIMPMVVVNKDNVDELYADLKSRIIKRKTEFDHFADFLENRTSWMTSPAAIEGSMAHEKGLLIHSVGVAKQLLRIKEALMPQLDDESAIIMALFHDVGKVGVEGKPLFLVEEKITTSALGLGLGRSTTSSYIINPKLVHMSVGVRSLFLVSQYMLLSDDEAQAICYQGDRSQITGKENPLTMVLETANKWQTKIYESDEVMKQYNFSTTSMK
ncbi:MAG: HD domain-containing protein [Clostridiaceae bacterium]|nr:HD domain-containing protein [Oscillospiraceae bacterium]NLO61943.1 HD domain-containing protein [Clostridiaceae bacterium]